jgi:lipopolysaccharide biosynthesis regulator YciM/uncharacterized integral membrane protein
MKRVLLGTIAVLALLFAFFLVWLNPPTVEFRFWTDRSVPLPLGWLLLFAFVTGGALAFLASSVQQLGRRVAGWRERRRARQAVRAGEWQESGSALTWDGDLERGRNLLRRAWRRQASNTSAALALASSYMDTGEYDSARQVLEEAVGQAPQDTDVRYALGELLRRCAEPNDAIRMLETVRVQHPRAPRALLALRELYEQTKAWTEAARVQEAYVQTLPDATRRGEEQQRLAYYRYEAALAIDDPAARAEALSAIVQSDRTFVPAVVSLGDALIASGRADEARKHWEKAFRSEPRLVLVERLIAHTEGTRERQRLIAALQKQRPPIDGDAVHLLAARVALESGDADAAAGELQAVTHQELPLVQRCWADVHERRGQTGEAVQALSRAADASGLSVVGYRCGSCGKPSAAWSGHCAACGSWGTVKPNIEAGC